MSEVQDNSREVLKGAYGNDGKYFVTGARDRAARVYDVDARGSLRKRCDPLPHKGWVRAFGIYSNGLVAKLLSADQSADGRPLLVRWDLGSCRRETEAALGSPAQQIVDVAVSPSGVVGVVLSDHSVFLGSALKLDDLAPIEIGSAKAICGPVANMGTAVSS